MHEFKKRLHRECFSPMTVQSCIVRKIIIQRWFSRSVTTTKKKPSQDDLIALKTRFKTRINCWKKQSFYVEYRHTKPQQHTSFSHYLLSKQVTAGTVAQWRACACVGVWSESMNELGITRWQGSRRMNVTTRPLSVSPVSPSNPGTLSHRLLYLFLSICKYYCCKCLAFRLANCNRVWIYQASSQLSVYETTALLF